MRFFDDKNFRKKVLDRAIRTVCQNLGATIPVGIVITPAMVEKAHWSLVYIIIAWLVTGLLSGVASILTSIGKGIPEDEAVIDSDES